MNIVGKNSIKNNIFSGSYALTGSATSIGSGLFIYFITGGDNIDSGYYATTGLPISGATAIVTNSSGYLYANFNTPIYGVCHGIGRDQNIWYNGFNFYNAFSPLGYFSPPYGESISIFLSNNDGRAALAENGSCSSLTTNEYNDFFGIVSNRDPNISSSSDSATYFINSPAIACPQDLSVAYYWLESQYKIIAGTVGAISSNTFFNGNPIPTSLDNFDLKTAKRYKSTSVQTATVPNGEGKSSPQYTYTIQYDASGHPIPNYNVLNNGSCILKNPYICDSFRAEGSIAAGTSVESQLLDVADVINGPAKGAFDEFNWWNTWHFLFKENSDGFPFSNSYQTLGGTEGVAKTPNSSNYGSNLFSPVLSDDQYYWQRRQCPKGINFLPHTFGGSIYACPSYYFDIPYYAATKKFGFYGTRFLNGCVSLTLNYPLSGHPTAINAVDLPSTGYNYVSPEDSEPNPDKGANSSTDNFNNLLKIAIAEEVNSDFYAFNQTFFLWSNINLINQSIPYQYLSGNNGSFANIFNNLFNQISLLLPSGAYSLLNNNSLYESGNSSIFYDTGNNYNILTDNSNYSLFKQQLFNVLKTPLENYYFGQIENQYSKAVLNNSLSVDSVFYSGLQVKKQSRFATRYFENFVKGNPIDLYPSNKINFSYDSAKNYIESTGWGKSSYEFNGNVSDTGLSRRYFLGAYSTKGDSDYSSTSINSLNQINNGAFYPGYFNSNLGTSIPAPTYIPVVSGNISVGGGSFSDLNNGWLAMGYNGVGAFNGNFSCFTPIFIQQPLNTVYCKIGQAPIFRSLAVDYHTIPEDKINSRYPEITYWTSKLKITDSKYNNLYPLSYKWYRISTNSCNGNFQNFLLNPDFSKLEPSNSTGNWCCLEGDGPNCTLIHPKDCSPAYTPNPSWAYQYRNTQMYQIAKQNNFYMTFMKGAVKDTDDKYYYFCMARGRFGIRISEPSQLFIEDWLKFDLSIRNGGNIKISPPAVTFTSNDYSVSATASEISKYQGFVNDPDAIPENIIEEQIPPPNIGFGDVYSYKFIGPWGYRGASQTYTPGTLQDTRGLIERWGRFINYGSLIQYQANLTQSDGDYLYGRNHLPICNSQYQMSTSQDGIRVVVNGIVPWANYQKAAVNTISVGAGVIWSKLGNAGELYAPKNPSTNGSYKAAGIGYGQWQWGNNLGTIHSFGWNSPQSDLSQFPYQLSVSDFQKLKTNLLKNGVLAGSNCGWHKNGLGRNMSYWIEGFNSFYTYCDPVKKKNVTNPNYMNPGLRQTNSSIQYFWLGKPSNGYLERYPMFGPYSYQWATYAHNRDRNGNGMSQGFYSYGWNSNYSLMYDTPAIYGLFLKYKSFDKAQLETINAARAYAMSDSQKNVRSIRFGFTRGNGSYRQYGDIFVYNITGGDGRIIPQRDYLNSGIPYAENPNFNLYGCSDADLKAGNCFDPCLSIRYQNGFLPGGKIQDLTLANSSYHLVPNSPVVNNSVVESTSPNAFGTLFRGAFGTPHLQYLKNKLKSGGYNINTYELNGFSPCFDGGADHCNYITPNINLGDHMFTESSYLNMMNQATLAAQVSPSG